MKIIKQERQVPQEYLELEMTLEEVEEAIREYILKKFGKTVVGEIYPTYYCDEFDGMRAEIAG